MKKTVLTLIILACAGCATTANYERVLDTWLGGSERDLVASWGIPDGSYQIDANQKIISYTNSRSAYLPGTAPTYRSTLIGNTVYTTPTGGTAGQVLQFSCKTDFTIENGQIVRWRYQGNSCRA